VERDEAANIYGRITALEVNIRTLMTALVCQSYPDPLKGIEAVRRDTFSTLQNVERPIGEFTDECWEEAVGAMKELFDGVEARIKSFPAQS
jgi:hypothetical protein